VIGFGNYLHTMIFDVLYQINYFGYFSFSF
jgi:hypothetical protein